MSNRPKGMLLAGTRQETVDNRLATHVGRDVVSDSLGRIPDLVRIGDPAAKIDHAKREVLGVPGFSKFRRMR